MLTDRIGYHLKRLQQALRLAMDAALRELNLTSAQYGALTALEDMPGVSSAALARACFVTAQTMNEIVQGLIVSGLVTRQSHPEHGRIVQLSLTAEGKSRLAQAHQAIAIIEEQMLAGLASQEQRQFVQWLQQCSVALEAES
jgi:DNA-binding MarR family transcriptional regulator